MTGSRLSVRARLAAAAHATIAVAFRSPTPTRKALSSSGGPICEALEERRLFDTFHSNFGGGPYTAFDPYVPCPTCPPTVAQEAASSNGGGNDGSQDGNVGAGDDENSEEPVRYADGQPVVGATDLSAGGFGIAWGQSRTYVDPYIGSNPDPNQTFATSYHTVVGRQWLVTQFPQLEFDAAKNNYQTTTSEDGSVTTETWNQYIMAVDNGTNQRWWQDTVVHTTDNVHHTDTTSYGPWASLIPFMRDTLVEDDTPKPPLNLNDHEFIATDTMGGQIHFNDFSTEMIRGHIAGQFKYYTDRFGNMVSAGYDSAGRITTENVTDASTGTSETFTYTYITNPADPNVGMISNVTMKNSTGGSGIVRQVAYAYYDSITDTAGGSATDLKSATIEDGAGNPIDTTFYRYVGGTLTMVFNPDAYARVIAAGLDPGADSDTVLAPFASQHFSYDGSDRVIKEVVQGSGCSCTGGGEGTYNYAYFRSSSPPADLSTNYNEWSMRTVETRPDNSTVTVFTNAHAEVIFKGIQQNGQTWAIYHRHSSGSGGAVDWTATPSAFQNLPSDLTALTFPDVINYGTSSTYLSDTSGLYYGNGYTGYVYSVGMTWHGNLQNNIATLEQLDYLSHTYSPAGSSSIQSVTVPLLAHDTLFGTAGADARVTTYSYTFNSQGLITSITASKPPIVAAQDGPASSTSDTTHADTTVDQLDAFGRVTSETDGDGYVTTYAYSPDTGALAQEVVDPTGLDLVTQYTVDALGRPTQIVRSGPGASNPRTDYVVYNDASHEERYYPGWNSTTDTTTGPISVTRHHLPIAGTAVSGTASGGSTTTLTDSSLNPTGSLAGYTLVITGGADAGQAATVTAYDAANHTLTFSPALTSAIDSTSTYTIANLTVYDETLTAMPSFNGVSQPTGTETIDQTNIQSLSRDLTNLGGQVMESDDYFSLAGVTYSQAAIYLGSASNDTEAGGNYHATLFGYDELGNQDRVKMPTGTIYRTVYDTLDRPVSHWVGTDDTPGPNSDDWSPTNNAGDMVDIQDTGYDSQNAPPPPVATSVVSAGGQTASTTFYVSISVILNGVETPAGPVSVIKVTSGHLLNVSVPATAGIPTGTSFNVYVGTVPGILTKQPTGGSVGSAWQEPSPGVGQTTGITSDGALVNYSGVGNGDLTLALEHPGGTDADRDTQMLYDWRDRLIAEKQGVSATESDGTHRPIFYFNLDNLGEVLNTYRYDGDGIALRDFADFAHLPVADADKLVAEAATTYDDQGRPYETQVFNIDPSTHQASGSLNSFTWYDHRGNVIKTLSPGGLVQKYTHDGADREKIAYTTDGGGDGTGGAANSWTGVLDGSGNADVDGDIVLSQVETQYDSDGNPVFVTDRERFNDATDTGALGNPGSTSPTPKARVYYSADYYDAADRLTDSVDFGTNGGVAIASPPALTSLPAGSLHTNYQYIFSTGEEDIVTDPRGIQSETFKDLLGRTTRTVEGHTNGSPVASIDQTTDYTYDGDNHALKMTAEVPGGIDQITQWVYGYSVTSPYLLADNDLLAKLELPDPVTGQPSGANSNDQSYTYDDLGETVKDLFDQNGTIRQFNYDVLGRLTMDTVPVLGSGVDLSTRSIMYAYDPNGQLSTATTYSGYNGSGTLLNQVTEAYNGLGQLTGEYQSHSGAVVTGTPEVQYEYVTPTGTNADGRLTDIIYPNSRKVDYQYNTGLDSNISRVSNIADDTSPSSPLEAYSYLGLDTIVQRTRNNNTDLTYIGSGAGPAGDKYVGLDEFGRVVDQNWQTTSTGTSIDRFQYGYDADGNVLYKLNVVSPSNSELYHANGSANGYDALNRLVAFSRGTLNGSDDSITTASHTITWNLDAVGNWSGTQAVVTDGTAQNRVNNARNEYTTVGSSSPMFDSNGNMNKDETGKQYVYDAWNRIVTVKDSSGNVLGTYAYDALGRRITQTAGSTTTDLYYDTKGSVLEEGQAGATTAQYVWGLGYPDALVERDAGGVRMFAQQDANWNVTSLADNSGNVQERYQYDPYGTVTVLNPDFTLKGTGQVTASGYNWLYLFQDGRIDTTSMLYHFRARDYSPTLGRWTEPDPLGNVAGANVYVADHDAPASRRDPSGLYDIGGHFYSVYLAALAAGLTAAQAYDIAYYAQLPDMQDGLSAVDALKDWLEATTEIASLVGADAADPNLIGKLLDRQSFDADVFKYLHSLHGGDANARRQCLERLLRNPPHPLQPWELGLILHAFGDAYAHTHDNNFNSAYGFPKGHLKPVADLGHYVDAIGNHPDRYQLYVHDMYSILGGDPSKEGLDAIMLSLMNVSNGLAGMTNLNFELTVMNGLARAFGYNGPLKPGPANDGRTLTQAQVQSVIDMIKKACC